MLKYENKLPAYKVLKTTNKERNEEKGLAKQIIALLPIITLFLLGLGILNQLIYYYPFHLDILAYTDVNEIIFETSTNFLIWLSFFVINILFTEIGTFFRYRKLKIKTKEESINKSGFIIRIKTANFIFFTIIGILTIMFFIYMHMIENEKYTRIYQELKLTGFAFYFVNLFAIASFVYFKFIFRTNHFRELDPKYNIVFIAIYYAALYTTTFSLNTSMNTKLLSTYGTISK